MQNPTPPNDDRTEQNSNSTAPALLSVVETPADDTDTERETETDVTAVYQVHGRTYAARFVEENDGEALTLLHLDRVSDTDPADTLERDDRPAYVPAVLREPNGSELLDRPLQVRGPVAADGTGYDAFDRFLSPP